MSDPPATFRPPDGDEPIRYEGAGKRSSALSLVYMLMRNPWDLRDAELFALLEGRGWRWYPEVRQWVLREE